MLNYTADYAFICSSGEENILSVYIKFSVNDLIGAISNIEELVIASECWTGKIDLSLKFWQ